MADIRVRAALAQLNDLKKKERAERDKIFTGKPKKRFGAPAFVLPSREESKRLKVIENKRRKAEEKLKKERQRAAAPKKKTTTAKAKPKVKAKTKRRRG